MVGDDRGARPSVRPSVGRTSNTNACTAVTQPRRSLVRRTRPQLLTASPCLSRPVSHRPLVLLGSHSLPYLITLFHRRPAAQRRQRSFCRRRCDVDRSLTLISMLLLLASRNYRHRSMVWWVAHFDILNRLGVTHECDKQTDGRTFS